MDRNNTFMENRPVLRSVYIEFLRRVTLSVIVTMIAIAVPVVEGPEKEYDAWLPVGNARACITQRLRLFYSTIRASRKIRVPF